MYNSTPTLVYHVLDGRLTDLKSRGINKEGNEEQETATMASAERKLKLLQRFVNLQDFKDTLLAEEKVEKAIWKAKRLLQVATVPKRGSQDARRRRR